MNGREAHRFYKEVLPVLSADRPQIVFDMSKMQHVDSIGIGVFLQCIYRAAKSDGEIKLAGMLPRTALVFELTRIEQLFEIYDNSISAVLSFTSVIPQAVNPHLR
jgi:anti-anti-sigma factor